MKNIYGLRWNVEIYSIGIKRLFGEVIWAVTPENIVQEMMLKIYVYNESINYGKVVNYVTDFIEKQKSIKIKIYYKMGIK